MICKEALGCQKLGEAGSRVLQPQKVPPAHTWTRTSGLQNCETINVCCLSRPACAVVTAAPGPSHTPLMEGGVKSSTACDPATWSHENPPQGLARAPGSWATTVGCGHSLSPPCSQVTIQCPHCPH